METTSHCKYCGIEIKGRKGKKFCNNVCRANEWTYNKRLSKKKEETRKMIEKANIVVGSDVQDLYKKIFGG